MRYSLCGILRITKINRDSDRLFSVIGDSALTGRLRTPLWTAVEQTETVPFNKWSLSLFIFILIMLAGASTALAADEGRGRAMRLAMRKASISLEENDSRGGGKEAAVRYSLPKKSRTALVKLRRREESAVPTGRVTAGPSSGSPAVAPEELRLVGMDINADLRNRFYVDIEKNDLEEYSSLRNWLTVEGRMELSRYNISSLASFDARSDAVYGYDSGYGVDILLREAYVQYRSGRWDASLGRQNITWGKLDDFTLLDILNPQDYTEFLLLDKQARKNPILMAKAGYYREGYFAEGLFIPWFEPNDIDFFDEKWAAFRYIKRGVVKSEANPLVKSIMDDIRVKGEEPEYSLQEPEFAFRLGGRDAKMDYSAYYMFLHDRTPVLRERSANGRALKRFLYDPNEATLLNLAGANPSSEDLRLQADYKRMHVIGADFETTVGNFGVRGENGIFFGPAYLSEDLSLIRRPTISSGIGIDHTTADNLYLNLQFIESVVLDNDELFFQSEKYDHQLVTVISKEFMRGKLTPSFYGGYNFSTRGGFYNPEITYKINGRANVSLGAYIFNGPETGLFGRFDDNDLLYAVAEWYF